MKALDRNLQPSSPAIGNALKGIGTRPSRTATDGVSLSIPADCIYDCVCDCGFVGTRDECFRAMCPNCGDRVRRLYE